ncbi:MULTISPECIES: linear amide C-N hydrolase [unclassified Prevotella]|uniref:linear amide C-N hydrolase n=1 Tax=unclassified Prevotella TaxID=2638335 RepID=UPI0009DF420D|nr:MULTISPECIES: linear amide C-N hydrolase [unclassified Prevotella]
MKKALKITLFSVLGLVVLLGVAVWMEFGPLVKGANSCVKLDDGLYFMEYTGDDGFDGLMAQGGIEKADQLAGYAIEFLSKGHYKPEISTSKQSYGCSALTVSTPDGGILMGRNFDFPSAIGVVMHCIPDKGYETITTFNVEFYNFGEGFKPEGFKNQYMSLTGLFVALDGINEKGLAIADLMAGDTVETHQHTNKPDLTTTAAIPYMLKNAANVDEALHLLEGIDMHSDIGSAHHYAMADATGRRVVLEYVDNKMVVVESPAVTNHYLCQQKLNAGLEPGDKRYDVLCERFSETGGVMTQEQLTSAIASVSQPQREGFLGTAWTMVMDLKHPSVTYYSRRHFNKPLKLMFKRG